MQASANFMASMTSSMPLRCLAALEAWPLAVLSRVENAGDSSRQLPRRFIPRLAAGFDEDAGHGLRAFDRTAPRLPRHLADVAVIAVALSAMLTFALCLIAP